MVKNMRQIVNLNEGWMFSKVNSAWEMVDFPHTWNGYDGQDGGDDYFRGTCMYSKPIRRALLPKADSLTKICKKLKIIR